MRKATATLLQMCEMPLWMLFKGIVSTARSFHLNHLSDKAIDAPEFLNRIDEFIIFKRLSTDALRDIVDIRLKELQRRLDDRRITLEADLSVRQWLAERGYDPKFGARPLNRLISKQIGNNLADQIIRGLLKNGDTAVVKLRDNGEGLDVVRKDI